MPHPMKKIIFCAISLALILLSACKKDEEPQSSPHIYMSYFTVNRLGSTTTDTLGVKLVNDNYVVDSISAGDTVHVDILINAVTNELTSFILTADTNYIKYNFATYKELENAVTKESDILAGILYFKTGYSAASLPFRYIARQSGKTSVSMKVTSTSQYSPATLSFEQPIK